MDIRTAQTGSPMPGDLDAVSALYYEFLQQWNKHSATGMSGLLAEDGNLVGFDGSQMNGRAEAASTLSQIFSDHVTGAYIGIIREIRMLSSDAAVLRAVAGMIPPGQSDINPAVNAIQSLVAVKRDDQWRIAIFQNTPAAFHERPELVEQLTQELRQALQRSGTLAQRPAS